MFYVKPYSEIVSDSHINPLGMIRLIFLSCKNKEFSKAKKKRFFSILQNWINKSFISHFVHRGFIKINKTLLLYFYTHTYFQIKLNMNFWHVITQLIEAFCTILTNGFPFQDIRFYLSPGFIKWIFLYQCLVDINSAFLSLLPPIILNTTILFLKELITLIILVYMLFLCWNYSSCKTGSK